MSKAIEPTISKSEITNWSDIVELHSSNTNYSEYFSNIVRNLFLNHANADKKSFIVTSPTAGEGKTTMAVNIAAVLASCGKRTILIDANFTDPALEEIFNISEPIGLIDVISGGVNIEDAVIQILDYPNLHLLTSGSGEMCDLSLSSEALKNMVKKLHANYDYIIFDTASTEESFDPIALTGAVDTAIIVAQCDHTSKESLSKAKTLINRNNGMVAGVILNKTPGYVPKYYRSA